MDWIPCRTTLRQQSRLNAVVCRSSYVAASGIASFYIEGSPDRTAYCSACISRGHSGVLVGIPRYRARQALLRIEYMCSAVGDSEHGTYASLDGVRVAHVTRVPARRV